MRNYLDSKPTRVQSSSPFHPITLGLLLALLAVGLLLLDQMGMLGPVRGRVAQLLSPAAAGLARLRDGAGSLWTSVGAAPQLQATAEGLRRENSALQATVVALQQAQVENSTLRRQLALHDQYAWAKHMLPAEVTVRSPDAGRRIMTISLGAEAGLQPGMAVVGQQGSGPPALVGVVEEVGPRTASVLLITDFGSQISARVLHNGSSATGVVQGQWQRGSRLRLGQVVRDALIGKDDPVVTAGLTHQLGVDLPLQAIPAGIPIGAVELSAADGHTLMAELRPFVDPDQVREVWVVLSPSGS
jgi:rod shape-determining protein MreC